MTSRRSFLTLLAGAAFLPRRAVASIAHPEPRPEIDSSLVLTAEQLEGASERVQGIFDMIREIPQIADGIGCSCGCSGMPTYRSLLTCYYETGMARGCPICQGEARLVYRRHKEGQTLEQIRRAIDARYG
jgi:hypothetical protein